jgi:hypothetical protein
MPEDLPRHTSRKRIAIRDFAGMVLKLPGNELRNLCEFDRNAKNRFGNELDRFTRGISGYVEENT